MQSINSMFLALILAASSLLAQAAPDFGGRPLGQLPNAIRQTGQPPAPAQSSCFAYRTKGGDAFQIACYQDTATCANVKTDYQRNPSIEAIGCAPQIHCFTYNQGNKSSACYADGNQCVTQRNQMASRSANVGLCVPNATAGAPQVQIALGMPPPPPGTASMLPAPTTSNVAGVTPTPLPPPLPPSLRPGSFLWTPQALRELYRNEDVFNPRNKSIDQPVEGHLEATGWETPNGEKIIDYLWDIDGIVQSNGQRSRIEQHGASFNTALFAGAYSVTLTAIRASGARSSTTLPLVVKDVLIAGIGDSFSSGEGNPDKKIIYSNDPLHTVHTNDPNMNYGSPIWADSETVPGGPWSTDTYSVKDGVVPNIHWPDHRLHSRCHRSHSAATPVFVKRLANEFKHLSFTMALFSCSGAQIDPGVLTPYMGVEMPPAAAKTPTLWPQLDDLVAHVGPRNVDALTVSIGGNDIGFADIVKQLAVETNQHLDNPQALINSTLMEQLHDVDPIDDGDGDPHDLPSKYEKLDAKIANTKQLSKAELFITEYPDVVSVTNKATGRVTYQNKIMWDLFEDNVFWLSAGAVGAAAVYFAAPVAIAGAVHNTVSGHGMTFDGVSASEASWGVSEVVTKLNATIEDFTIRKKQKGERWNYVGGIKSAFLGHGYCSERDMNEGGGCDPDKSWVRNASDSARFQGPTTITYQSGDKCLPCKSQTKGTIHPNEKGHQAIADQIYAAAVNKLFTDINISLNGPATMIAPNSDVHFVGTVRNSGPASAKDVRAAIFLPPGFSFNGCRIERQGAGTTACSNELDGSIFIDQLDVGQEVSFSVSAKSPNVGSLCNADQYTYSTRAIASSFSPDKNPANNGSSVLTAMVVNPTGNVNCSKGNVVSNNGLTINSTVKELTHK